jgi:BolA protein
MSVEQSIHQKLTAAFAPLRLDVVNDSARHAGHAGTREMRAAQGPTGETHFNVVIVAEAFTGVSRVARQRLVYDALKTELAGPVHALSVKAHAPGEI